MDPSKELWMGISRGVGHDFLYQAFPHGRQGLWTQTLVFGGVIRSIVVMLINVMRNAQRFHQVGWWRLPRQVTIIFHAVATCVHELVQIGAVGRPIGGIHTMANLDVGGVVVVLVADDVSFRAVMGRFGGGTDSDGG